MVEARGNIWEYRGKAIIAITTNGQTDLRGRAVIGAGVARQSLRYLPDLPVRLGRLLMDGGNHVHELGDSLVSFPVEETLWSRPDSRLIACSAQELRILADCRGWRRLVVPRPGCGSGGLQWQEVRPLLEAVFDDRFIVIDR